jgi:hypothetical protein
MRRDAAFCLINGDSLWWFDMWGGCYQGEKVLAALRQIKEIWDEQIRHPARDVSESLVDPEQRSPCTLALWPGHHPRRQMGHRQRQGRVRHGIRYRGGERQAHERMDIRLRARPAGADAGTDAETCHCRRMSCVRFSSAAGLCQHPPGRGAYRAVPEVLEIALPTEYGTVTELFTGETYRNTALLRLETSGPDTRLFLCERGADRG